jgi:hypothetical protein
MTLSVKVCIECRCLRNIPGNNMICDKCKTRKREEYNARQKT